MDLKTDKLFDIINCYIDSVKIYNRKHYSVNQHLLDIHKKVKLSREIENKIWDRKMYKYNAYKLNKDPLYALPMHKHISLNNTDVLDSTFKRLKYLHIASILEGKPVFVLSDVDGAKTCYVGLVDKAYYAKLVNKIPLNQSINYIRGIINSKITKIILNQDVFDNYPKANQFMSHNTDLTFTILGFKGFWDILDNKQFNSINRNSLFILNDINWSSFIALAKSSNPSLRISGGSAGKRHLISKLNSRINSYLLAIVNLDYPKLNAFNDFDSDDKNRYLPYFDFSSKNSSKITHSHGKVIIIPKNSSTNSENSKNFNENNQSELINTTPSLISKYVIGLSGKIT